MAAIQHTNDLTLQRVRWSKYGSDILRVSVMEDIT